MYFLFRSYYYIGKIGLNIRITEKSMEVTIQGLGFRIWGAYTSNVVPLWVDTAFWLGLILGLPKQYDMRGSRLGLKALGCVTLGNSMRPSSRLCLRWNRGVDTGSSLGD